MRVSVAIVGAVFLRICCALPTADRPKDVSTSPCNEETEFDCGYEESGKRKCIPIEWMCDNVVDCSSNSKDESMCRYVHFCLGGMLACRNGMCVDALFKCNGFDDCGDGTDERGCGKVRKADPPKACRQGFFRCLNGPCITVQAKCDQVEDCPEGDDEKECPKTKANDTVTCAEHQFKCDNMCIPRIWKCDGVADCDDGTDEIKSICEVEEDDDLMASLPSRDEYHSHVANRSHCSASEFLCEPGMCIAREKLCDSRRDCPKGNDEGGLCGECASFGCSHLCTDTPDGAMCSCREGEKLGLNGRTCEDVDECVGPEGSVCSQRCVNAPRGFECACFRGYQLGADGRTCHALPDPYSSVFFSLGSEVRHMPPYSTGSMVGYGVYQRNERVGTVIKSLAFSPTLNRLFMAVTNVEHQGQIHSASGGLQQCVVDNVVGIANLAIDWITNNIYYTAQYPSELPGVSVCLYDGRFCRQLVAGIKEGEYFKRQAYRGLVLDPVRATMYWIDAPGTVGHSKIMMAEMDGSKVRGLVTSKLEHPQGLAMDFVRQKLYFADTELQLIERVDVVTRERSTVASRGVHQPFELAFFDDFVYWTDWHTEAVLAARVGSNDHPHVAHSIDRVPYGLAVNHSSYWGAEVANPCESKECGVCVLGIEAGRLAGKCLCPNLYKRVSVSRCEPMNSSEVAVLGYKQKLPSISTATMGSYCDSGAACLNGGVCERGVNSHGHVENITCSCRSGFAGLYCDIESASLQSSVDSTPSIWLILWLVFCVLGLSGAAVYLLIVNCPPVRRAAETLMQVWPFRLLFRGPNDIQTVIKEPTLTFGVDRFENPSFGSPVTEDVAAVASQDASPYAFNEPVPESSGSNKLCRLDSSSRFSAAS